MTLPINDEHSASTACPQSAPDVPPEAGSAPSASSRKPESRAFAVASAGIGTVGTLAYCVLALTVMATISGVNHDLRGSGNPRAVVGAGFGAGIWLGLYILPIALLLCLANGLGLLLSSVALCRSNGRALGLLGLLLNTVPVIVFFAFLSAAAP